jgi:hypothetical protein
MYTLNEIKESKMLFDCLLFLLNVFFMKYKKNVSKKNCNLIINLLNILLGKKKLKQI